MTNNLLITARDFLGRVSYYAYMYRCSVLNKTTRSYTQKSFSDACKGRREGENRRDIRRDIKTRHRFPSLPSRSHGPMRFVTSHSQFSPEDEADNPMYDRNSS